MSRKILVCDNYKIYQIDECYNKQVISICSKALHLKRYLAKQHIPINLNINDYFIDCCYRNMVMKRVSTYEFSMMYFEGLIKDSE